MTSETRDRVEGRRHMSSNITRSLTVWAEIEAGGKLVRCVLKRGHSSWHVVEVQSLLVKLN